MGRAAFGPGRHSAGEPGGSTPGRPSRPEGEGSETGSDGPAARARAWARATRARTMTLRRLLASTLLAACVLPVDAQSLFQEQAWHGLTSDNKAYRPGDVLTVQVFENSSATSSADT